ncbi:MAG: A/G-specific adenine glycosylase [Clostridia bacterium]|nr:A/G-specific adenine glycosylase [Clostridia bacterium]
MFSKDIPSLLSPWYRKVARPLPWRENPTPYRVWLSEIMLQQTRVEAVIPYYQRFLSVFPTLAALAEAEDALLMKCWEGLGYYSRARNLKKAAVTVMTDFGGVFPSRYEDILSLSGIGEYTAGAIGSIAFGLPTPAVDGNVLRILARLLGDGRDVLSPALKKEYRQGLLAIYPSGKAAGELTQAFMELGQRVCTASGTPKCAECPLASLCASKDGGYAAIPYRAPKKARKIEKKTVLLLLCDNAFALSLRPAEALLGGLWEFPNVEGHLSAQEVFALARDLGLSPLGAEAIGEAKHIFTHLEWHMRGFLVPCEKKGGENLVFATDEDIQKKYAIASAFRFFKKFIAENK